ncbi:unnamed protein product [Peronospora belbahrii]|uniref:Spen paralogue and orthologue SPOC C-terminal domain-containing protein n=1 Tax=Peronospora belbahrii TaxID=622444 RepID=A0ABN8D244_9STRA|nr:unnamed protein product [Peronospora belbahrii]
MEGKDSIVPLKAKRRSSGEAIYEKYLNIKSYVLPNDDGAVQPPVEISNSTDEKELEAGEVVSNDDITHDTVLSGSGVSAAAVLPADDDKQEPEEELEGQLMGSQQEAVVDTLQPKASASYVLAAEDNTQLTAVGTSCTSVHSTIDAHTVPLSPSAAAFERDRAPVQSSPLPLSHPPRNEQYAASRGGGSIKVTNDGRGMTSRSMEEYGGSRSPKSPLKMMRGPEDPLRGRSRNRSRSRGRNGNGMPGDINGDGQSWPPRGNRRSEDPLSGHNGYFDGHARGVRSPQGRFGGRPGSPCRRPGSPPRGGFDGRPVSPLCGGCDGKLGSPSRGHFNGRLGSPLRGGFSGRPGSPSRGGFNGRLGSPPRGGFNGRPGSPPRGGFDGRHGSPLRGGFDGKLGSPPRGGHNSGMGSPLRNGFQGGRSPRRDGFNGHPGGPRGRSPPREGYWRGQSMSPGRGGPRRDFRDGGRDSPRGRMIGECGPGGPRRSRSRSPLSRGPQHVPPRNGPAFGLPDRRSRSGSLGRMGMSGPRSPGRMGMGGPRSPPRNGFDGRGPGSLPPFKDSGSPMMGSPRGGGFPPHVGIRGPCSPSLEPDGRSNTFRPRGRSRSMNRPPSSEVMRKRDRSWERGGPPQRPLNNGPLPDSPRVMEPGPFEIPSEWNFELKRSGKVKCRCSATSLSVGISRQLPLYLDVVTLPHLKRSPEFLQLDRPNIRRVVYELKPESMADASGYREFVDYLIEGRGGHARAGAATEMEPQGFKIFLLPPGQAARQIGYKGDHMIAVLRSR